MDKRDRFNVGNGQVPKPSSNYTKGYERDDAMDDAMGCLWGSAFALHFGSCAALRGKAEVRDGADLTCEAWTRLPRASPNAKNRNFHRKPRKVWKEGRSC